MFQEVKYRRSFGHLDMCHQDKDHNSQHCKDNDYQCMLYMLLHLCKSCKDFGMLDKNYFPLKTENDKLTSTFPITASVSASRTGIKALISINELSTYTSTTI